ncbi:hypothetical protein CDAR_621571 [Caerostris darwini]|uniref:Uncharacterized protein n=1 Tax=Caerostris darwini TaxID=1538125 RepID=A0AAV4P8D8_9ARAC|nr:hypothetical protein CDAR_621571 [Caerostris darwini]
MRIYLSQQIITTNASSENVLSKDLFEKSQTPFHKGEEKIKPNNFPVSRFTLFQVLTQLRFTHAIWSFLSFHISALAQYLFSDHSRVHGTNVCLQPLS